MWDERDFQMMSRLFKKVPTKTGNDQLQATDRLALYNNLTNVNFIVRT